MTVHSHCPDGCEHPQPVMLADGREVCGRCFFRFDEVVEMVPCTPELCGDDAPLNEENAAPIP